MNTISKELLSDIVYATNVAVVWADLKERFNKVDRSRGYRLHIEIFIIHHDNLSISTYFSRLRLLWDEFDPLVPSLSCEYDKSRTYVDHIASLRLFSFLMGLNKVYTQAQSQILIMIPLPCMERAYAIIMADKS